MNTIVNAGRPKISPERVSPEKSIVPGDDLLQDRHIAWLSSVATVFLQGRQYSKALPLLLLLLKLRPNNQEPLKQLAYLYYQQGKYERAIQCCLRYEKSEYSSTDARLYLLRSFSHLKIGQPDLALDYYQKFYIARNKS